MMELVANALCGEGNRLSLILAAPLGPWQIVRAKCVAHLVPALLVGVVSASSVGALTPLLPHLTGVAVLLVCMITSVNVALLVGGSVVATDLSVSISSALEEILFEGTPVMPVAAVRLVLTGASVVFQALAVTMLFLPYWWTTEGDSFARSRWCGLVAVFVLVNTTVALGALRAGVVGLGRLAR